jgi:acetyltransferase-like isoleucine patch superfamily enzyme
MAYFTDDQIEKIGFKSVGKHVKISDRASIYNADQICIGDHSRIDDFCVISGKINIGRNVHITPQCLVAGGKPGIEIDDFVALAYGVKVFAQSDDYSGETMTNSTIPSKYKKELMLPVSIKCHSIVGACSVILPGVTLSEGTAIGAMSLVLETTEAWSIYVGTPAVRLKSRKQTLLSYASEFLSEKCS